MQIYNTNIEKENRNIWFWHCLLGGARVKRIRSESSCTDVKVDVENTQIFLRGDENAITSAKTIIEELRKQYKKEEALSLATSYRWASELTCKMDWMDWMDWWMDWLNFDVYQCRDLFNCQTVKCTKKTKTHITAMIYICGTKRVFQFGIYIGPRT